MAKLWSRLRNEQGSLLLGGVMLALILTMVGLTLFDLAVRESKLVLYNVDESQALRIAEAGIYRALRQLSDPASGANGFCTTYGPCSGGIINQASPTYALFSANTKFPDSGAANGTGAYTVTTHGFPAASPMYIEVTSAGCFPTPSYGSPNCPTTGSAPTGVARKIIKANIAYSTGGFLGGFWGDSWIDFGGSGNRADSFDSRNGKNAYSSSAACATVSPGTACYGNKADLFVRAGTGTCTSNCGPTPDSKCYSTGACAQQPSTNIKSCNCALYMDSTAKIWGTVTTAPNQTTSGTYLTSKVDDLAGGASAMCSSPSSCTYSNIGTTDSKGVFTSTPITPGANGTANKLTGAYVTTDCSASGGYTGTLPLTGSFTYSKGDLTITGPTTWKNTGGTICVHGISFSGAGAQLTIPSDATAPSVIRMEHHFTMTAQNQIANLTHKPDMFQIVDSYGGGAPGQVLYGGTDMYLVVNTPGVNIVLNGGDYFGAMIGRSILATSSGTKLHVDEALPFSNLLFNGQSKFTIATWAVQ